MTDPRRIPWIPSFGRTQSRHISPQQKQLMRELLPAISVQLPEAGVSASLAALCNWQGALPQQIWLEIGFGGGEHLLAQAKAHPDTLLIGCEPFPKGVASLLTHIRDEGLDNIRILQGDARFLLDALPDGCLDRAFILFPDPWPKTRHHKRRIVNHDTLALLARTLKPGAELRLTTDMPDYASWMLQHLLAHPSPDAPAFAWQARTMADITTAPGDWVPTRYQAKATKAGRGTQYLRFLLANHAKSA